MALEGATPYALTELEFDWHSGAGQTRIAAVAKETLAEAESFAVEHGLAPVAFVALPSTGWNEAEAFFGPTAAAGDVTPEKDPTPYVRGEAPSEAAEAARNETADEGLEEITAAAPQAEATAPEPDPAATAFQSIRRPEPAENAPKLGAAEPSPVDVEPKITLGAAAALQAETTAPPITRGPDAPLPEAVSMAASLRPVEHPGDQALRARSALGGVEPSGDFPTPGADGAASMDDEAGRRGKPRFLALILTVLLILGLLAVAALAAVNEDGLARYFQADVPDAPEPPIASLSVPETALPETTPVAIAPAPLPPEPLEPVVDPFVEELAVLPPEVVETPPPLTEADIERFYAATGIWKLAPVAPLPPLPSELQSFYITSIDRALNRGDAVALAALPAENEDQRLGSQPLPPGPEVRFQLDARGLVVATPEGALSPLGVTVFAGRPPLEPPLRVAPEVAEAMETLRLAGFRPRLRPENLVEDAERIALGGFTLEELAAFRPRLRPAAAKVTVENAPLSALAIAASLRPETRPQNFDRIIAQTRASQPTTVAVAAAVAPQTTRPSGPTRASVARAATTENVINLRRVNLIGVYGTPSNRSALVRLANGRFVRVQVGDRVDGGRVAAISETALRYVKGGRNVTLEIPSS